MPGDLVSSKYPLSNPFLALLGQTSNVVQSNLPARSNAEPGFGWGNYTDGALAGSGILVAVPVPVDLGVVISKVSILVGATGASTPTHQFAALYAGTGSAPALLGQSADATTTAIPAASPGTSSGLYTFTLSTPQLITAANAPNGFIYAGVSITASTVPTAVSMSTPNGINYQWCTGGPLYQSMTAGSALGATAAATIASPSQKAVAPVIILT